MSQEERDAAYHEARRRIFGNEVEAGPSESNTEQDSSRTRSTSNESQEAGSLQLSLQSVTQSAWTPVSGLLRPFGQSEPQGSKTANQADSTQQALSDSENRAVFGSTLSDIIIVVTFAKSIYRRCRDAGGEYAEMSREVRGLYTVLRHLKYEVEAPESLLNKNRPLWVHQLAPIIGDCDFTLRQLDNLIFKYRRVGSDTGPKALWDKTRFGSNEMDQLGGIRAKLISHTTSLTLFLDTIQLRQSGKLATPLDYNVDKLDLILDKVDIIATRMSASNGAYSRLSYNEDDSGDAGREVWKQLKRELVAEGFTSDVLEHHKVHS